MVNNYIFSGHDTVTLAKIHDAFYRAVILLKGEESDILVERETYEDLINKIGFQGGLANV